MKLFIKSTIILIGQLLVLLDCKAESTIDANIINRRHLGIIENAMDLDSSPCDDFYKYACGNWAKNIEGVGREYRDIYDLAYYQSNRDLSHYLSNETNMEGKPVFVLKTQEYLKSCLNLEHYTTFHYLMWLKNNENLNLIDIWGNSYDSIDIDWIRTLAIMHKYGQFGIFIDRILSEGENKISIALQKVKNDFEKLTRTDFEIILDSLNLITEKASFENLWLKVSKFEDDLETRYVLETPDDTEKSEDIQIEDITLPWLKKYLEIALANTNTESIDKKISVQDIPFMVSLATLMADYEERFICQYLSIRFIWHILQQKPDFFHIFGCMKSTRYQMPIATQWIYEQMKSDMMDGAIWDSHHIFHNVKMEIKEKFLKNENGLSGATLVYLLYKLDNMQLKIGNFPRNNALEILENFYSELNFDTADFYGNHLQLLAFNLKTKILASENNLPHEVSQYFDPNTEPTLDIYTPYYNSDVNTVVIPSTILQRPLFDRHFEDVFKYSIQGAILGHEIVHGFDFDGFKKNTDGGLNAKRLIEMISNTKFNRVYRCMDKRYGPSKNDKLADVSGLAYAYNAFATRQKGNLDTRFLVNGLNMTVQQIFFLNYAMSFCSSYADDGDEEHGTSRDRLNDAVYYSEQFAKAFDCKIKQGISQRKPCQLWL
ncbi:neprilysin-3-like [Haematobia irritans]|uniref:neprilysin-3-like n=1 Tax=Haematobia irritans TaxID=7368 RepID=UPI003F5086BD